MKNKNICLMYHQIQYPYLDKFYVHPDSFKEQITYLLDNKLCGALSEIQPLKGIIITFDDGHKTNLQAAKWLSERGVQAVFYVVKDFSMNIADYLNEAEIKEISDMGHLIGVHGKDHDWWTKKSAETLISELTETKEWIEKLTGRTCITCSAPGGRIFSKVEKLIRKSLPDLIYIRNSRFWFNNSDAKYLNSIAIGCDTTIEEFKKIVNLDLMYYWKSGLKWTIKETAKRILYKEF